jgi:hypothetical protein
MPGARRGALAGRGGGSGLWLRGDLAKAVRRASAAAVIHWRRTRGWKARELRLLGKLPDEEVARRTGRTANGVRVRRTRRGIPTARDRRRRAAEQVQSQAP